MEQKYVCSWGLREEEKPVNIIWVWHQTAVSLHVWVTVRCQGSGPTRAERLGHQPRQAAGDLGPGEVVVVEAPDGRDDEGPSHPSVIRRISHLRTLSGPRCARAHTHTRGPEDRAASSGIPPDCGWHPVQRNSMQWKKKSPLLTQGKKNIETWPRFAQEKGRRSSVTGGPSFSSGISFSAWQLSLGGIFREISSHSLTWLSSGCPTSRSSSSSRRTDTSGRIHASERADVRLHVGRPCSLFYSPPSPPQAFSSLSVSLRGGCDFFPLPHRSEGWQQCACAAHPPLPVPRRVTPRWGALRQEGSLTHIWFP